MRVFLTGGTGLIGSAIIPELISSGHQVLGLARSETSARALLSAGAEVLMGTLEDVQALSEGASKADGVIHCAFDLNFANFEESSEIERLAIALDSSDIVAVESGSFCKFLLRQTPLETERSHRASEQRFDRLRGHLSSFRDDHYESTHDECYLFSCVMAWDRIAETRAFAAAPSGGRPATEIGSATYTGQGILSIQRGLAS